ncbi:MAG: SDR family oxidoreductase [Bryobacteraceae bacterium]
MKPLILVTGATGYVGRELLGALLADGRRVRCLARQPEAIKRRWTEIEVVQGDALSPETLPAALAGVHTAYYLIHSMGSAGAFEEEDRRAARNFADAARANGVKRIIYLGGLGEDSPDLSPHLRSRHEVGGILRGSGIPVIEFRASVVLGPGSLSFEMIRSLVERLPVMIAPRWVSIPAQPIAIQDLLEYLLAGLDLPCESHRIFEIGGADQVSYGGLMQEYARQRGLTRLILPVPLLTPRLSSLWLGLVTPLYVRVGRKLIDSIRHPTVVRDSSALREFRVRPRGHQEAIAAALKSEAQLEDWTDLRSLSASRFVFAVQATVNASPEKAFTPIRRIGGKTGWYYADWLWRLRGALDRLIGGPGIRAGRIDPDHLKTGDTVDCWRVEAYEENRRLRLAAQMKLPGRAWLEFRVDGAGKESLLRQTAVFDPRGLLGRAYWYLSWPVHRVLFPGMLRRIVRAVNIASM